MRTVNISAVYGTRHFRLAGRGRFAESAMIAASMPSPIGHALGRIAVAWAADLVPGDRAWRIAPARRRRGYRRAGGALTLVCAGLGAAPDLDLVFIGRIAPSPTASARSCAVVAAVATGWVTRRTAGRARRADVRGRLRLAPAPRLARRRPLSAAAASRLLWPFSRRLVHLGLRSVPADRRGAHLFDAARPIDAERRARSLQEIGDPGADRWCALVASTCKSPGPTCARAGRRRPSGAAADTAGTSDRRGRRAARSGSPGRRRGR